MFQNDSYVSLRKTTIVDVNEDSHQLPPDHGAFNEFKVADYNCPDEWIKDGIFVEVKEGQPMWFDLRQNEVCACLPSVQRLNPVTGEPANLDAGLTKDPTQNYLMLPGQLWLDGYARDGKVYQFIVTKAGVGLAVNEFALPKHMQDSHALAFAFFQPKNPPPRRVVTRRSGLDPIMTQPMWFSPMHTPHSWIGHDDHYGVKSALGKIMGSSMGGGKSCSTGSLRSLSSSSEPVIGGANFVSNTDVPMDDCMELGAVADEVVAFEPETVDILEDRKDFDKASMGMGGRIKQRIKTDGNTVDYYHEKPSAILTVYLALPEQYKAIMKKGKRQDSSKKDKFINSGQVGKVQVPLVTQKDLGH